MRPIPNAEENPKDAEYTGTVVKVVIDSTTYFGVNYRANGVGSLTNYKLPDADRTVFIQRLRDEGNWDGARDPQFFRNAEFTTLYLAAGGFDEDMKPVRKLPKKWAIQRGISANDFKAKVCIRNRLLGNPSTQPDQFGVVAQPPGIPVWSRQPDIDRNQCGRFAGVDNRA